MLVVNMFDEKGKLFAKEKPLSLRIDISRDIPAHSAEVVIPYNEYTLCADIEIYNNEKLIFAGSVDEEIVILNSFGKYIKYLLRSKMALLLDNEVEPKQITLPTGSFLGKAYLEPLAVEHNGKEDALSEVITLEKGMTIYDLINKYSAGMYGVNPYMGGNGVLLFDGPDSNKNIEFSNNGGIKYNSLLLSKNRSSLISCVRLKLNNQGYTSKIENPETRGMSIIRERYVDGSRDSGTMSKIADKIIEDSNRKYVYARLECIGEYTDIVGAKATIDEDFATEIHFVVKEIKYVYNSNNEKTVVVLEREI